MKFLATITVDDAKELHRCLVPEVHSMKRGSMSLDLDDKRLTITIDAQDATALRALTNSVTQMISIFETTGTLKND